jgi:hypothetical protein
MSKFPKAATATAWAALGWNDFAATHRSILSSGRGVPMRLSRWTMTLQEQLLSFVESWNLFYAAGIEDCMLYAGNRSKPVPPCHLLNEYRVKEMSVPWPCDFCGKVCSSMMLVDAGLLSHHLCSTECIKNKTRSVIESDVVLSEMYRMLPYRSDIPIPEDADEMKAHFASVPYCGLDSIDDPDYVLELTKPKEKVRIPMKTA